MFRRTPPLSGAHDVACPSGVADEFVRQFANPSIESP